MKRLGLIPRLLSATLFVAPLLVAAEPGAKPAGNAGAPAATALAMSPTAAELLRRFDKNGDGKLDDDERAEAHETILREQLARQAARAEAAKNAPEGAAKFRARMLEMFDRNHDGRLDDEERAAARRYAEEHGLDANGAVRGELLERFDKNGNGRIDDDERPALQAFLAARQAQATSGQARLREELLRHLDRNHDGRVDDEEMLASESELRMRIEAAPRLLVRCDRNGDGKLDDDEWTAARAQIQKWLNEAPATPAK